MKRGRFLEQLVAIVEKAVVGQDGALVSSPHYLRDKTNGRRREHDVVLELNRAHHHFVIAIECKDHSRPVGSKEIEAFRQKCTDTGVDQGVIVSCSGFTKAALSKADAHGIRCLTLAEASSFSWIDGSAVAVFHEKKNISAKYRYFIQDAIPFAGVEHEILTANRERVSEEMIRDNIALAVKELGSFAPGHHALHVNLRTEGFRLRVEGANGERAEVPLKGLLVYVEYDAVSHESGFTLNTYADTEIASAPLALGDTEGTFAFVNAGGKVSVNFVPDKTTRKIRE